MELPVTGDNGPSSWHVALQAAGLGRCGSAFHFLGQIPGCRPGWPLWPSLISSVSVQRLTHCLTYCLAAEVGSYTDGRERNLEMEHIQHGMQTGEKLWIVLE